jgi:hypothetical protein
MAQLLSGSACSSFRVEGLALVLLRGGSNGGTERASCWPGGRGGAESERVKFVLLKTRQIPRCASRPRCCQQSRQARPERAIRPDPAGLFQQRIDKARVVVSNSRWSPTESLSDV